MYILTPDEFYSMLSTFDATEFTDSYDKESIAMAIDDKFGHNYIVSDNGTNVTEIVKCEWAYEESICLLSEHGVLQNA